ncbi:metal ABC transporter ATP-binding protein [Thermodesulfobacteriota bacterium]
MEEKIDILMEGVTFSYNNSPILEDVNLKIKHGEFASIIGPNGSGKTTLLKLILGLIKPDKGVVSVLGQRPEKSRIKLGYMPQSANLDMQFPVNVLDVVLMGRLGYTFGGRYYREDLDAAKKALSEVKLKGISDRQFNEISGGQRQRVLIARALCSNPELLLLDEPTSNIDPEVEETIFEILKEFNRRMTILVVSHDIGVVSQIVKSVICVNRQVVIHPTSDLNGQIIKDIYGPDLKIVRHDHRCSEDGHKHV